MTAANAATTSRCEPLLGFLPPPLDALQPLSSFWGFAGNTVVAPAPSMSRLATPSPLAVASSCGALPVSEEVADGGAHTPPAHGKSLGHSTSTGPAPQLSYTSTV